MGCCVRGIGKVSRVALTAAKLGLTLDNAFKPRQARSSYHSYYYHYMLFLPRQGAFADKLQ